MPEETDSWFKNAFGIDLGKAVDKIKDDVSAAVSSVAQVVGEAAGAVNDLAVGAGSGSFPLGDSVGRGGKNAASDVRAVQAALGIPVDGDCGPKTIAAIKAFQTYIGHAKPDGRVDAGGATERALAADLTKPAFTSTQVEPEEEVAVLEIERSSGATVSSGHDEKAGLVSDLLGHQAALLQALQNAGSEAEREQISEELEGVNSEIDIELSLLKAAEDIEEGDSVAARPRAKESEDESVVDEVLKGDFHEGKTTWTGTLTNVGVGVVPVLGQVADARDTIAAAKNLYDDPSLANAGMLGLAAVGWVPLFGDAAKGVVKVGKKAAKEGSEEVLEEASGELVQQATKDAAQEAETKVAQETLPDAEDFAKAWDDTETGGLKADGDLLQLTPHGKASDNRAELGLSGKEVESGHLAPQAIMKKNVVGYNANHALTRLLDKSGHQGMDAPWKRDFTAMRQAGQTTATAQMVFDTVAKAIREAPGLEPGERSSLVAALVDEMFMQHGLKPDDLLELPYPNVKPKKGK